MGSDEVQVEVKLVRNGSCHQSGFGYFLYARRQCAHDVDLFFKLRMTSNQWQHVASVHERFVSFPDCTLAGSGIMCSPDLRTEIGDEDAHTSYDMFAGGFLRMGTCHEKVV